MTQVDELAQAALFIAITWIFGRIGRVFQSQLVGEIIGGIVLSEYVIDWLPYEDAIFLVGRLGLILLVMEGGLSVQLDLLPKIGVRAMVIAVIGTALPVGMGWAFMRIIGRNDVGALAAGAALSSTSIGMASKMLQQLNQLHTPLGNLIAVAAMVDDVVSLVILAVIQQLDDADQDLWVIFQPIVISTAFIVGGAILVRYAPVLLNRYKRLHRSFAKDTSVLFLALAVTAGLSLAAGYSGTTFLLGAFVAGMAFSNNEEVLLALLHFQPLTEWLTSIFFVSIGLVIPVNQLFSGLGIGYGLLYTIPAFIGKALVGGFASRGERSVVAVAMVGRGELGFLMAQESFEDGIIDELTFATCVWALLLCTLVAPFLMKWRLGKMQPTVDDAAAGPEREAVSRPSDVIYVVKQDSV